MQRLDNRVIKLFQFPGIFFRKARTFIAFNGGVHPVYLLFEPGLIVGEFLVESGFDCGEDDLFLSVYAGSNHLRLAF